MPTEEVAWNRNGLANVPVPGGVKEGQRRGSVLRVTWDSLPSYGREEKQGLCRSCRVGKLDRNLDRKSLYDKGLRLGEFLKIEREGQERPGGIARLD